MLYCHESDCLLFLASPLVDGLEALTSRGLFISDIPIHDATRDIILVGEQSRAQVGTALPSWFAVFNRRVASAKTCSEYLTTRFVLSKITVLNHDLKW